MNRAGDHFQRRHDSPSVTQAALARLITNRPRDAVVRASEFSFAVALRPGLDPATLERAFHRTLRRHGELLSAFRIDRGEARVESLDLARFPLVIHDAVALPEPALRARLRKRVEAGFPRLDEPLTRLHLYDRGAEGCVLLLQIHHLVADGWSLEIAFRDMMTCYLAGGRDLRAHAPAPRFEDFVDAEDDFTHTARGRAARDHWARSLAAMAPPVRLPYDRERRANAIGASGRALFELRADSVRALDDLARRLDLTRFAVLFALFALAIGRISGARAVPVAVPVARRNDARWLDLVGYVAQNVYVLAPAAEPSAATFRTCGALLAEAFAHEDYPALLAMPEVTDLRAPGAPRAGYEQVSFAMWTPQRNDPLGLAGLFGGEPDRSIRAAGFEAQVVDLAVDACSRDLRLNFIAVGNRLAFTLLYNADLFDAATARSIADIFRSLAEDLPSRL